MDSSKLKKRAIYNKLTKGMPFYRTKYHCNVKIRISFFLWGLNIHISAQEANKNAKL